MINATAVRKVALQKQIGLPASLSKGLGVSNTPNFSFPAPKNGAGQGGVEPLRTALMINACLFTKGKYEF
jgi:hypothetical protein